jgi:hypothetical protein
MSAARRDPDSQHYEIRVRGQLGATMLRAFPALQAEIRDEDTLLLGALTDQSALHGVLAQIEALGLELLELRRLLPMAGPPGPARARPASSALRSRLALRSPRPRFADNCLEGAGGWDGEQPGREAAEEPADPAADRGRNEYGYQHKQRADLYRPAHDERIQQMILDESVDDEHHENHDARIQRMRGYGQYDRNAG